MASVNSSISIRPATEADVSAINSIYNYYVAHSTCTYQTEAETDAVRLEWLKNHGAQYPVTVAEDGGQVVGWASVSMFRPREAYRPTVENAVYVRHDLLGRGIGKMLMIDLIERTRKSGFHSIMAVVSAEQEDSVRLHERLGFEKVAHLRQVGRKFDTWLDVVYLQLML
ncbi:MAG TPA: GNAT family N-acetyltransferase [Tepidisphaeraceae bacterium]|nr:GNAT family N-acetyltransferase [Tepidisphaeraceae bacterium]